MKGRNYKQIAKEWKEKKIKLWYLIALIGFLAIIALLIIITLILD